MKLAAGVLAVAFAVTQPAFAAPARAPSPAAAGAAFGRLIHQRYGAVQGYRACPAAQTVRGRIGCLGEVHRGRQWHQISASARLRNGRVVLTRIVARSWARHWWPYSRRWLADNVPGVASVNSVAYDWSFLASGAGRLKSGDQAKVDAYDGDAKGWSRFYVFRCSRTGRLITCQNALGDAMRYQPART